MLIDYKDNIEHLQEINGALFSLMIKLGVIVPYGRDEMFYTDSLFARRLNIFKDPLYRLTINPTLNCNFSCWYCYEKHTKKYMSDDVHNRILKLITNIATEQQIEYFHLDWFGGEPLLCYKKSVVPITQFARNECAKHNIKFSSGITTNGYLITPNMFDFFREVNMQSFQITLDGPENIHNSIRFADKNHGSYNQIVKNISLLAENLNPENLCLRINYTSDSFPYIDTIIHSFDEKIRPNIKILLQQVWQDEGKKQIDIEDVYKLKNKFDSNGFKVEKSFLNKQGDTTCYADNLNQAVVNYDGRIFKCTALNFEEEKEDGNLAEDGNILWTHSLAYKLQYATFENEHCKECKFLPLCYGPCHKKIVHYRNGANFDKYCFKYGMEANIDYLINKFAETQKPLMSLGDVESL